jgi:hypothetical protein
MLYLYIRLDASQRSRPSAILDSGGTVFCDSKFLERELCWITALYEVINVSFNSSRVSREGRQSSRVRYIAVFRFVILLVLLIARSLIINGY